MNWYQFISLLFICIEISCGQQQAAFAGPPGWRMVDRFYGFRYELNGGEVDEETIRAKAQTLGCFGWVQISPRDTLVGEVRCNSKRGPEMEAFLRSKQSDSKIRIYEDTKIRLHFSSFKVLPKERDTCFLDPPHQCEDMDDTSSTAGTDEL